MAQILLGARIVLDHRVDAAVAVAEDGCEDAVDPLLFALHTRNYIYITMPTTGKWHYLHFGKITVGWAELTICLKRNFNTAHSCSSSRNNFFVQVESPESHLKGFG